MAEKALRKLEEQLNCSICLDIYTDPKQLQCNHIYCQQCLVPLVVQDQKGQLGLTCPTCRQVTPIPDRGVAGLQPAFHINRLLEIQDAFVKSNTPPVDTPIIGHCFDHPEQELKLYCETCGERVCYKCALKGGRHQNHDYEELAQAFSKYKKEITAFLGPLEKQVAIVEKALAQFDTHCGEISDQQAGIKNNIRITFRELRNVLRVRETDLISQLDRVTQGKLKGLAVQRDQIETTLAQLCSCLHFLRESTKADKEGDVLMMKGSSVRQAQELITPFQPDILKPDTDADIAFTLPASPDITALCRAYGQIDVPERLKYHVSIENDNTAFVGETSAAILQAMSKESVESFECEVASRVTGARASCNVERYEQGQCKINYLPTVKGQHRLTIKAEGQHVSGSPFHISVKSPIGKLGSPILAVGGVEGPWGVTVNQRGETVVTEVGRHCVSLFGPNGDKIRSFGTHGSSPGQFRDPRGVAVDDEGNILVADCWNHRVQKFTADGQFLAAVGTKGRGPLNFSFPAGIACSKKKVYVVDSDNHRVRVLNSDLNFMGTIGGEGNRKGQFGSPIGIACDSTGKVFVADSCNNRIQVFTPEGVVLGTFGRHGQGEGELDYPFCVTVDDSDMVYVSESGNHRVSVFTWGGDLVTAFGKRGVGLGEFHFPHGVAVDSSGVVFVCDSWNNRVQFF